LQISELDNEPGNYTNKILEVYMSDPIRWEATNDQYLSAALNWLRLRLERLANHRFQTPLSSEAVDDDLDKAAARMSACEAMEPPPPLVILSRRFDLSRFEQETLLLCAGMEFDPKIAALCARIHGDPNQAYPTFALALSLFDEPAWEILSPERPLRYWRMIEINQSGARPLTTSPLRADERIVNYIKGLNYLDDRLMPLVTRLDAPRPEVGLPPSQQTIVDKALRHLQQIRLSQRLPVIQLLGAEAVSKRLVAWHIAKAMRVRIYHWPLELMPAQTANLETLARLWQRESLLLPIALYLDAREVDGTGGNILSLLNRFLVRSDGLFFLDTRDVQQGLGRATLDLDISKPTTMEQQATWMAALGTDAPQAPALLSGQFNLEMAAIQEVAQLGLAELPQNGRLITDLLWDACLVRTRPRLDTLAQRLEPKATWDDIVLRGDLLDLLHQIANQVRQRGKVYDEWGFRQRTSRGLGMIALFAGESGTGKTMAAEVIANDLRLNLYRIDLSAVVSKYIGETEKNLRRLFDAAEDGGAILFFDEADALFGKRSQVRDSHDRYANIETNYLLQRMEAYQGLAILATNMRSGLDDAFTRRIRFIVNFPFPEREDRCRIWRKIFPPETPVGALDYDHLARFNLAGGSIYNIALNAAFLAAQTGTPVTMSHLLNAIRTELLKSDRLIDESKFLWEEPQ
jgi:hypothetical protein